MRKARQQSEELFRLLPRSACEGGVRGLPRAGPLADGHEVDDEDQGLVGADRPAGAAEP